MLELPAFEVVLELPLLIVQQRPALADCWLQHARRGDDPRPERKEPAAGE